MPLLVVNSCGATILVPLRDTVGDGVTTEAAIPADFVETCDGSSDSNQILIA